MSEAKMVNVDEVEGILRTDTSIDWASGEYSIILPQILKALKVPQKIPESIDGLLRMKAALAKAEATKSQYKTALEKIREGHPADSQGPSIIIRWSQEIANAALSPEEEGK